jgi:hypothetical protein
MRVCLHKFVALMLVSGMVIGSMSLATSRLLAATGPRQAELAGQAEQQILAAISSPTCDALSHSANCAIEHSARTSAGMGCCGCFIETTKNFCDTQKVTWVAAFGLVDVTGDSQSPVSLLRPPRA